MTTQVQYVLTVDDIETQLVTQYATTCSDTPSPPSGIIVSPSLPVPPSTSPERPQPGSPTPTPTPYITTIIEGSITRRSTVYPSGTIFAAQASQTSSSSHKVPIAPIVGGVVGGVVVAAIVGFLVWYFMLVHQPISELSSYCSTASNQVLEANILEENIPRTKRITATKMSMIKHKQRFKTIHRATMQSNT